MRNILLFSFFLLLKTPYLCFADNNTFDFIIIGKNNTSAHVKINIVNRTIKVQAGFNPIPILSMSYKNVYDTKFGLIFSEKKLPQPVTIKELGLSLLGEYGDCWIINPNDMTFEVGEEGGSLEPPYKDYWKPELNRLKRNLDFASFGSTNTTTTATPPASGSDLELPLKINGYQSTHTASISAKGNEKPFPVRTKSGKIISDTKFKTYEAWTDVSWATIKLKTEYAFLLKWDDNMTGNSRTANVYVKTGGITSKMIVSQPPLHSVINRVWIEHNKIVSLRKGMKIHINFTTYGVRGKQGTCVAYFSFSDGTKLRDYNGYYNTTDGHVAVGQNFVPSYDSANYSDFVLFIPYSELHVSGHADCKVDVEVQIGGDRSYSESVGFTLN